MDWETEERILAPKSYTSQSPSTSVVPTRFPHDKSDDIKKREVKGISRSQKYGRSCDNLTYVRTASSQVAKDENTDRVHWDPPCEQSTHNQE